MGNGAAQAAQCNDCHTPSGFAGKYLTEALNGFNHSRALTTGRFLEPICVNDRNRVIAEKACLNCHGDLFYRAATTEHRDALIALDVIRTPVTEKESRNKKTSSRTEIKKEKQES